MVEDTATDVELAVWELKKASIDPSVLRVETEPDFRNAIETYIPDLILSDFSMPHFDGLSALKLSRELVPDIPFIFVSGTIGEENAIESLKRGATDYVLKTNLTRLPSAVERALREKSERADRKKIELDLNETRERFSLFMRYLPGLAFIKDTGRRYRFVNPALEHLTGKSSAEVLGHTDAELWPELEATFRASDRGAMAEDGPIQTIETFRLNNNEYSLLVHKFHIPNADGRPALIGGVAIDFTERVRAEEKVERLSRIQAFLSRINSAIVRIRNREELLDEACRIAVELGGFNLAWVGMLDKERNEVRPSVWAGNDDRDLTELRHSTDPDRPESFGIVGRAIREKSPIVVNDIANDDRVIGIHAKATLQRGYRAFICLPLLIESEVIGVLTLYSTEIGVFDQEEMKLLAELAGDVSFALESINKQEQLDYFAYYDSLTGLPNRVLFCDRVNQYVQSHMLRKKRMAVVVLDIERFGFINDSMGRHVGDALLKLVAHRLQEVVENAGRLSRIGANTYALSFADVNEDTDVARALEENVFKAFSRPFKIGGQELRPAFKCGVAMFPGDGADAEALLKHAEIALKKAKDSGDKYLFYAPQMNARVAEILSLENKLRIAIIEEQFVLYYQPKFDFSNNQLTGVEALIRWDSPEMGLVPPSDFIPILEETGMILDVGMWVLKQAVKDQRKWRGEGLVPPRIAINISSLQLRQKGFVDDVVKVVGNDNNDPIALDFEITESVIMEDIEQYIPRLTAIKVMGIGIEIDDFGTGYSSLSYIAKLPITALKIDRSFTSKMTTDDHNMMIVSTIISLTHSLHLKVTAEGVETEEQCAALKKLKCDRAQGYLFGKPMAAVEIAALLTRA
jgi:diguanylate cyclase (GGDEF)-like protein/PAS domain S-box-containing protein